MASVYFVLDQSGSMYSCLGDTLGGFNCFISNQKKDNPEGTMSLYFFNNSYSTIYENTSLKNVEDLTSHVYKPSGGTALLDAIGATIVKVAENSYETPPTIVILTDGCENSSTTYTKSHINDLIKLYKEKDRWNFIFLAANQDAITVGNSIGISHDSAMTFEQDTVQEAFEGLSAAMGRQMTGEDTHVQFTGLERAKSQPAYAPETPSSPMGANEVFTGLGRC